MSRASSVVTLIFVVLGLVAGATAPVVGQSTGVCGPLDNGRVADVFYEGTVAFWNPVVQYEYDRMTLTISGPCETIVKTFKRGEQIFFDLGEIQRVVDGRYQWQLRATPTIDSAVQEALQASRGSGEEDAIWWNFWQKGSIPAGPSVDGAAFTVERGVIIDPGSGEESQKRATLVGKSVGAPLATAATVAGFDGDGAEAADGGGNSLSAKDFVIIDDLIVDGSACIGFDCVNGESFGFDTIRLKENNLRIKFDDTSTAASFPRNDWQITVNDSANGGASKFSIDDISGSRTPFTIEAGARSHSLYVDDGGRLGLRTSTPSTEIHTVDGDTPTLRLQQDGSSGFAPQTWDVAGNETNFFIRDVTNGSALPLRIRPGAPSSSIDISADGDVGIGTSSPQAKLHIVENGATRYRVENTSAATQWDVSNDGNGDFAISLVGTGGNEFEIEQSGQIGNCGNPDHDFVISTGPGCTATPRSWIDAGATSFSTSSSRTYKKNLKAVEVPDIVDRIGKVPVYEYDFIGGPKDRIGLMAEDFHQVFERGSDKELSGQEVQIALWLAVQELTERTNELRERDRTIEQLLARVEALEAAKAGDSVEH